MAERFPQRGKQIKVWTAFYILKWARIRHHPTSLIVISQKSPQSIKENNSGGILYDCPHPKIEFDVQDESKLLLFLLFFVQRNQPSGSLRPVQSKGPPTVPHSASLFSSPSFRLSSSLAVKESAAVWSPLGWMRRISPFGWLSWPKL